MNKAVASYIAVILGVTFFAALDVLGVPNRVIWVIFVPFTIGAAYGWFTEDGSIKQCAATALGKGVTALLIVAVCAFIFRLFVGDAGDAGEDWDPGRMGR